MGTLADPVGHDVTITTANSTNAEYVHPTDAGRVTLDFTGSNPTLDGAGLNSDARTYVGDVFRIRYEGDAAASVWVASDAEGITFLVDGDPIETRADAVTLAPDESVPVGVVLDTIGSQPPASAEFTVRARVADAEVGTTDPTVGVDATDPVTTRVTRPTPTSRRLNLRNTVAGRPVSLDVDPLTVDRSGSGAVTLDGLTVVGAGGSLELNVASVSAEPTGTVSADAGVRPVGAIRIEERQGAVERATLRFGVDRAYLDTTGIDPEDLTVYRFDDGSRTELDVEVVGKREGQVVVEVLTPGFSSFVVGADTPDIRVTSADIGSSSVVPDGRTTVTASRPASESDGGAESGSESAAAGGAPVDTPAAGVDTSSTGSPEPEPAGGSTGDFVRLVAVLIAAVAITALARRIRTQRWP